MGLGALGGEAIAAPAKPAPREVQPRKTPSPGLRAKQKSGLDLLSTQAVSLKHASYLVDSFLSSSCAELGPERKNSECGL